MSLNGRVPLSAIDLLGLAEQKKVARVDLGAVGYGGVVYVCDLTTAQQQKIVGTPRKGTKIKRYDREEATEFDMADLANDAGAKFLEACLVTDKEGGAILDRAFEAGIDDDGNEPEWITFPAAELVYQFELMVAETKVPHKAREKLEAFPNAVTNIIVRKVRELSGMAGDRVEEKKDSF